MPKYEELRHHLEGLGLLGLGGSVLSLLVLSDSLQPHGLYSLPGSSVHGISQARVLEWVAIPFSRGSP